MLVLEIEKKEYKIEFSIEASLNEECVERAAGFMCGAKAKNDGSIMDNIIDTVTDIPGTTLSMFYASLLEHHGENGDGTVKSKAEAKALIKKYFAEHKDDGKGNFYAVMQLLIEQMMEDGFFKLIGLEQTIEATQTNIQKMLQAKTEQTKKTTKKAEATGK